MENHEGRTCAGTGLPTRKHPAVLGCMVQAHALDVSDSETATDCSDVQAKLRGARVVLVVLSPDYCSSWWCVVLAWKASLSSWHAKLPPGAATDAEPMRTPQVPGGVADMYIRAPRGRAACVL